MLDKIEILTALFKDLKIGMKALALTVKKFCSSYVYIVKCKVIDLDKSNYRVRVKYPNGSAKWYRVDKAHENMIFTT